MAETYYEVLFALSLVFSLVYVCVWHKHFSVHFSVIFLTVPITNLGFMLLGQSMDLSEALLAVKITYIGGIYLILFTTMLVFNVCRIHLPRAIIMTMFVVSSLVFLSTLTIGKSDIFYKSCTFSRQGGNVVFKKEYGIMHTVTHLIILILFMMALFTMIYSLFRKSQVSRKTIYLLMLPVIVCISAFFLGRKMTTDLELLPLAYVFSQIFYLIIIYRTSLYDVTDTAIDSMVQSGDTGFISCDYKFRYLGSNETAKTVFPELSNLTVDKPLARDPHIRNTALRWLKSFSKDKSRNRTYYEKNGSTYLVNITYLFDGLKKRGYQIFISDDTRNQKYIRLINSFNTELKSEVAEKTQHIVEMHDNLVLSMATMVESRDNSTGGHIKRTSECVRMLIEEMKKDDQNSLSEEFCRNIIKAAPMHDLGKIAVDDAILRKPGRFTDEEYTKMKTHAAEGARIVHEILKGTDDLAFHHIAENVAHYHHERWDGSGYPDGLRGTQIPLEARIMAIADVYDALVSKRVYKEKMSFDKADSIIIEGMGTQFDKSLEPYYVAARPNLEAYYSSLEPQEAPEPPKTEVCAPDEQNDHTEEQPVQVQNSGTDTVK